MKHLSILMIALVGVLAVGCDVERLVADAENGLSQLTENLKNLSPAGTNDDAMKPADPITGQPNDPNAPVFQDNPVQVTADPGTFATGSQSCGHVMECVVDCYDDACVEACAALGSEQALYQVVDLVNCANLYLCENEACLEQVCFEEISVCFEEIDAEEHDAAAAEWEADGGYDDDEWDNDWDEDDWDEDDWS